jgi:hypothetical protein
MAGGRARDGEGDETKVVPRGNRSTGEMPCGAWRRERFGPQWAARRRASRVGFGGGSARWLERLKPGAGASSGGH